MFLIQCANVEMAYGIKKLLSEIDFLVNLCPTPSALLSGCGFSLISYKNFEPKVNEKILTKYKKDDFKFWNVDKILGTKINYTPMVIP